MEIRLFPSLEAAERCLKQDGYSFLGAPSRWRKDGGGRTCYADARAQGRGAVVIITDIPAEEGPRPAP